MLRELYPDDLIDVYIQENCAVARTRTGVVIFEGNREGTNQYGDPLYHDGEAQLAIHKNIASLRHPLYEKTLICTNIHYA